MDNNTFKYTYSAKEQEEIKKIREKYVIADNSEEDKMEQLRRLDSSVTQKGTSVSLVIGVVSALILGTGMSLVMVFNELVVGIIIGIVGIVGVSLAYPVYMHIVKKMISRRALSALLGVNPNTIQKAYHLLEEEGIIHSRAGAKSCVEVDEGMKQQIRLALLRQDTLEWVKAMKQMGVEQEEAIRLALEAWRE